MLTDDKPVPPPTVPVNDDPNPPTERTRAIHASIAADTRRVKSSTVALTVAIAAVVACAVGIVLLLILRR